MTTKAGRKAAKNSTRRHSKAWKDSLHDPEEAAAYLNAALEVKDFRVLLLALRDVAEARGVSAVAAKPDSAIFMLNQGSNSDSWVGRLASRRGFEPLLSP